MKSNYNQSTVNTKIKENISAVVSSEGYDSKIATLIKSLFSYMIDKQLYGGCHALSSVLYVALSELGYKPKLLVGECQKDGEKAFDHSWIELDGKIFDLSIYYPLTCVINSISGPIIFGYDMITMKPYTLNYGINTGLPFSTPTEAAISVPLTVYMDNYPMERGGLWRVLEMVFPNGNLNIQSLKVTYSETYREIVR